MSWYRTGTISLTNGSAIVTGAGTDFIAGSAAGEGLMAPDGKTYEISAVNSSTQVTLGSVYLGSTASGQAYSIIPSQSYLRDLAAQAAALVAGYQTVKDTLGSGIFPDGTLAATSLQFTADPNTGLRHPAADTVAVVTGGADRITVSTTAIAATLPITVSGVAVPTISSADTLTNKTLALGSNTVSGTLAQFNAAITDGDLLSVAQASDLSLAAISKSIHSGAIVKSIIYDTSKDSDGGAWRKRCSDKSWYTEALGFTGTWGGQAANVAAGWAACGSVVGGAYQNTTDGKFYTPTSSTTQTEIFRGNVREFPEQVAIVAEAARVVIYDLTQVGTPMWASYGVSGNTSVCMSQGAMYVGRSGALTVIEFVSGKAASWSVGGRAAILSEIGSAAFHTWTISAGSTIAPGIVNATVNDVALTVLDTAPIDPSTQLPVPTIAVATAGGVSVIKDDGTVVNSASVASASAIQFDSARRIRWLYSGAMGCSPAVNLIAAGFLGNAAGQPMLQDPAVAFSNATGYVPGPLAGTKYSNAIGKWRGGTLGVEAFFTGGSASQSMVAAITNAYNTGWLPGDIRGAYLADTTAETITASGELVTNGTFTTDTSGWTARNLATLSVVANAMRVAYSTQTNPYATTSIATVIGSTYSMTATATWVAGATGIVFGAGTASNLLDLATSTSISSGTTTQTLTFKATGTTTFIGMYAMGASASTSADFDNISVKLADPDRSVKAQGLVLNGSLTKTAVASGAGLVAYSGFSASNYLEAPYSANLDFGTGDFCVMGWVKDTDLNGRIILERNDPAQNGQLGSATYTNAIRISGASQTTLSFAVNGAGVTSSAAIATSGLFHICCSRLSGVLYIHVNGVQVGTVANTGSATGTNHILRLGNGIGYNASFVTIGSLALWRISATAPSADQIAHIYRTELPLFQAGAQCTIAGTSTAVTALAYDDVADTLHVGTSWGRSAFKDLLRVDSEATTTGALTSLSANQGAVLTGGASSGRFYQPAMLLRDELRRKDEARKALGRLVVPKRFTATAAQTVFVCTKGYEVQFVYANGLLKTPTTDYTVSDDGFQKTVTMVSGVPVNQIVCIMMTRS